jgi:hypothetical protein
MGGQRRADAQVGEERLDLLGRHPLFARVSEDLRERAAERGPPLRALDVPAAAHRGVLLGDGDQLEPDALNLQRACEHLRREARDVGRAVQDRLEVGVVPAGDVEQRLEQDVQRLLRRRADDHRRREGRGIDETGGCVKRAGHGATSWRSFLKDEARRAPSPLCGGRVAPASAGVGRGERHFRRGRDGAESPPPSRCPSPAAHPGAPSPAEGEGVQRGYAARASTSATVWPNEPGSGATVSPYERMISAFSAALSPAAEMIAPGVPHAAPPSEP